jgi:serine phosphatase RsbU (regulator of sigma subunit)
VLWDLFPDASGSDFETHYRRAVESGEPVEFEAYYPPPLSRWYEVRAWPTPDGLSVYFIDVTERRDAQRAASDAVQRTALLSSITEALSETLEIEEAVAHLARVVVGPWADWSLVTLVDQKVIPPGATDAPTATELLWRRGLRDVASWHIDPDTRAVVERYRAIRMASLTDAAFLAQALRENRPVIVAANAADTLAGVLEEGEARDLCLLLAPASAVVLPLRARGRTVGVLSVFRGAARGRFSHDDVADLVDAAGRAGLALDNARLYAQQRDLAEGLQRSLLSAPPAPDHLHIAVRYQPAAEAAQVGGDWYDAFLQPDGATSIVIGDVVGHDTAAAAAMGQVRGLLRGIAVTTGEGPADVLRRVDEAMQTLQVDTTATAIVARLEQTDDERRQGLTRLRWSNAGHPPPLVALHPEAPDTPESQPGTDTGTDTGTDGSGAVTTLWSEHDELLLGLDPHTERTESVLTLTRGTTVLLYTDGLVERRGQPLEVGVARLEQVLTELVDAGLDLEQMCDALLRRLVPARPEDDVAIVAVRLHPEDRPRPAVAGPAQVPDNVPDQG